MVVKRRLFVKRRLGRIFGRFTRACATLATLAASSAFLVPDYSPPHAPPHAALFESREAVAGLGRPTRRLHASPQASRRPRLMMMVGSAGPGGGDLAGGADAARNAQLASLKKMFYEPSAEEELPRARSIHDSGFLLDMPLCRWSWVLLPGQQLQLNVWQPQYTLMFEKILASPPPHYYFHVLLPGGTESLGKPEYELRPGTQAPLAGTLVKIVLAQREQDSRLSLVVQGLARGSILKQTQALPYARGHVQLLPDMEALIAGARAARRVQQQQAEQHRMKTRSYTEYIETTRLLAMTAAAKELVTFWDYEVSALSFDTDGTLASLNQVPYLHILLHN